MNFTEYQQLAQRTARKDMDYKTRLAVAGLGITGEAGELADHIKKHIGHSHILDSDYVIKEAGDIAWYLAEICSLIGVDMETMFIMNIEKLKKRYPTGFEVERSINRKE